MTPEQPNGSPLLHFTTTSDPVVAFDNQRNLYYAHNVFNQLPSLTKPRCEHETARTFVSTYADDAATYVRTVRVPSGPGQAPIHFECGPGASRFDDKEWITVDRYDPGTPQRIYVTWTRFQSMGGDSTIWVSHSDDGGRSFSQPAQVNTPLPGEVQDSMPTTDPSGNLYVVFAQLQFGSKTPHGAMWVDASSDGGETFTQTRIAAIDLVPSPLYPSGFRVLSVPTIGADVGGVYAAWPELSGDLAVVAFSRSTDGARTWSPPVVISDSPRQAFAPAMVVAGGSIHIAWYDSRFDTSAPGAPMNALDVFYRRGLPGPSGTAFGPLVRVTDASFNPDLVSRFPVFCSPFIGDYIDIDAVGSGNPVTVWTDNRNVVSALTDQECQTVIQDPTNPAYQDRLNSGALDQEAFVQVIGA